MQTPVERAVPDDRPGDGRPGDSSPGAELLRRVSEVLAGGGRVALPTESLYGLACRGDDEAAVRGLRETRPDEPFLTWAVPDARALERLREPSRAAERLADRYWPGPLTLLLPGAPDELRAASDDGWIGLRAPAHSTTSAILRRLDFPVVLAAAGSSDEAPAEDAAAVERLLRGNVDLIVDGGPTELREPSTVLRCGGGKFELLREGLIDLNALRQAAGLAIAFVCTGNTCRSPMAEVLARRALARRLGISEAGIADFGFSVRSLGVFAGPGSPASDSSVVAMRKRGLDLSDHRSTPAEPEALAGLDRVYALTRGHADALLSRVPDCPVQLLDPDGRDVPDPFGGSLEEYLRCADSIEAMVEARLDEWA